MLGFYLHNCGICSGENGCDYQFPGYCIRTDGNPYNLSSILLAPKVNQAAKEYFNTKV